MDDSFLENIKRDLLSDDIDWEDSQVKKDFHTLNIDTKSNFLQTKFFEDCYLQTTSFEALIDIDYSDSLPLIETSIKSTDSPDIKEKSLILYQSIHNFQNVQQKETRLIQSESSLESIYCLSDEKIEIKENYQKFEEIQEEEMKRTHYEVSIEEINPTELEKFQEKPIILQKLKYPTETTQNVESFDSSSSPITINPRKSIS